LRARETARADAAAALRARETERADAAAALRARETERADAAAALRARETERADKMMRQAMRDRTASTLIRLELYSRPAAEDVDAPSTKRPSTRLDSLCTAAGARKIPMPTGLVDAHLAPEEHACAVAQNAWSQDGRMLGAPLPDRGLEYVTPQRLTPYTAHHKCVSLLASIERARQRVEGTCIAPWCVKHEASRGTGSASIRIDVLMAHPAEERALSDVRATDFSHALPWEGSGNTALTKADTQSTPPATHLPSSPLVTQRMLELQHPLPKEHLFKSNGDSESQRADASIQAVAYAATWLLPIVEADIFLPEAGWWAVAFTGHAVQLLHVGVSAEGVTVYASEWQPITTAPPSPAALPSLPENASLTGAGASSPRSAMTWPNEARAAAWFTALWCAHQSTGGDDDDDTVSAIISSMIDDTARLTNFSYFYSLTEVTTCLARHAWLYGGSEAVHELSNLATPHLVSHAAAQGVHFAPGDVITSEVARLEGLPRETKPLMPGEPSSDMPAGWLLLARVYLTSPNKLCRIPLDRRLGPLGFVGQDVSGTDYECLGRGGYGMVFATYARDSKLPVAAKFALRGSVGELRLEASVLSTLSALCEDAMTACPSCTQMALAHAERHASDDSRSSRSSVDAVRRGLAVIELEKDVHKPAAPLAPAAGPMMTRAKTRLALADAAAAAAASAGAGTGAGTGAAPVATLAPEPPALVLHAQHCLPHVPHVVSAPADEYAALITTPVGIPIDMHMQSLKSVDQRRPVARVVIRDVLRALALAHTAGWVHRDVRPCNVIWSAERSAAVLIDWGMAVAVAGCGRLSWCGAQTYVADFSLKGAAARPGLVGSAVHVLHPGVRRQRWCCALGGRGLRDIPVLGVRCSCGVAAASHSMCQRVGKDRRLLARPVASVRRWCEVRRRPPLLFVPRAVLLQARWARARAISRDVQLP
ncbi:hypothetical protein EON62_00535, partial [archaeon]